jgi:biotin operon repressor
MKKDINGFIDLNGEVHEGEGIPVWIGRKTHFTKLYGRDWMVVAQNAFALMVMDTDLTLEPKNILMYLFSRLDFENYIQVPQVEIAEKLNIQKQNVNRSIKLLEKKGILIRGPKIGRSSSWRLNPNYGFKGNPRGKVGRDLKSGHLRLVSDNENLNDV